nr:uncharacterized protein LOC125419398 [Ziziphus jujuba var. spinosa]
MGMINNVIPDVKRDLFLLENQLPYIVLKALMSKNSESDVEDGKIMIGNFIKICQRLPSSVGRWWFCRFIITPWLREREGATHATDPHHLLDLTRTIIVDLDAIKQDKNRKRTEWYTYYSATVLKFKGIRFRPNTTGSYSDVKFSSIIKGVLTLPPIFIDTSTDSFLLNLAAFKANPHDLKDHWCGITSHICFHYAKIVI